MTLVVAVGSVKGTGGASTTALGLAAALGERGEAVLVEADPSGGSLLGWCPTLGATAGGLYEAVFDRDRNLGWVRQSLGDISVVVAHGDPYRISAALERPRSWRQMFDRLDADVVMVDVGRLFPGSPALPLAGGADRLVLVSPPAPAPLAATVEWIGRGGQHSATDARLDSERMRIVSVDVSPRGRHRVDPGRLSAEIGDAYVGHVPFDDAAVELVCRGSSLAHRSLRRSSFAWAVRSIGERVLDPSRVRLVGA